ncbi:MAG: NAD(P)-binding domain-containing protein [Pseudomonadota bacterium]
MRSSDDTVIGFVGLGNMGVPMCKNLADAGFAVIAYDTDQAAGQRADAAHDAITVVTSLEELAGKARHIVLMVPDSGVVARVVCGDSGYSDLTVGNDGLSRFIEPGSIIADMSSSFPPATVALGEKLQEANITLIDAPVSGGVRKAVTAELAIMAGGNTAAIDAFANAFSAMGNVFRTGGLGSGHATKALNN